MPDSLIDTLPLPQRLALAYAPASAREATLSLFALDARLAQALRAASEPIVAQMRLAWWRDQFSKDPAAREDSDPLLAALTPLDSQREHLLALVDGWELLVTEDFGASAARAFASARAQAFLGLARLLQVEGCADEILTAGQRWALADLAANIGNPQERETVHAIAGMIGPTRRLPRALRPLTVLDGLARRSLAAGAGAPLLHGPLSGLAAMRLGLFGR